MGVVYKIVNIENGHIYIGSTIQDPERRWYDHQITLKGDRHNNAYLQAAWNKYGPGSFKFEIVEEAPDDDIRDREQEWIDEHFGEGCYNLSKVAHGSPTTGIKRSKEVMEKIAETQRKMWENGHPPFMKEAERRKTPEYREKMRKRTTKLWKTKKYRERVVNAIKKAKKENPVSRETKKKMSISANKRWSNPKVRKEQGMRLAGSYNGFVSPSGSIFSPVINMRKFCRAHDLCRALMHELDKGERDEYKGWTRYEGGSGGKLES